MTDRKFGVGVSASPEADGDTRDLREATESALTMMRVARDEAVDLLLRGADLVEADGFTLPDGTGRLAALMTWARNVLRMYRERPAAAPAAPTSHCDHDPGAES